MNFIKKLLVLVLIFTMTLSHLGVVRVNADDEESGTIEETTETTPGEEEVPSEEEGDITYEVDEGETGEETTVVEADDYSIEYLDVEGVKAVTLQGRAATDQSLALNALKDESDLDSDEASDIIDDVFAANEDPEYPPRDEDGTQIENVSIKWITEDTVDDGDPNLLSITPADDSKQSVRLRVSYALSGEFDYQPGDITITIPASIFKGRNGEDLGKVVIPYAQYPSTKNEFNYQLIELVN